MRITESEMKMQLNYIDMNILKALRISSGSEKVLRRNLWDRNCVALCLHWPESLKRLVANELITKQDCYPPVYEITLTGRMEYVRETKRLEK